MVLIVAASILLLGAVKNTLIQNVLAGALSRAAHVPVKMSSVNMSFLSGSIRIKNLKVYNPRGFEDKLMLEVPQIYIVFDAGALLKKQMHFKEVDLDLKELVVVKSKDGRLNVNAVKPSEEESRQIQQDKTKKTAQPPKLQIDKLSLSIGRVVYKDYSGGGAPAVQNFEIHMVKREYNNIHDPKVLVSLIMFEALTNTTLSRLANLDAGLFKDIGSLALKDGMGMVGEGKDALEGTAKKLLTYLQ